MVSRHAPNALLWGCTLTLIAAISPQAGEHDSSACITCYSPAAVVDELAWEGTLPSRTRGPLPPSPDILSLTVFTNSDFTLTFHPNGRVASLELSAAEYNEWFLGNQSFTDVRNTATRLYTAFQDLFDFIFFINNGSSNPGGYSGRHYGVRNDVQGIGSSIFDNTAAYGSDGQLQSVLHLRTLSNLRGGPSLHEIMHRWANRLDDIPNSGAHWGFSSAGGQLGGWRPGTLVPLGGNSYDVDGFNGSSGFGTIANGGNGLPYSPLELYLMGLTATGTVTALNVAENAAFTDQANGIFTSAVINVVSISDIVATEGTRVPSVGASQTSFRGIVVVLTDTPLTRSRWEAFDTDAALFELNGDDGSSLFNYWEANGGRATLDLGGLDTGVLPGTEHLQLAGSADFHPIGFDGGPFTPACEVYTLTNPSPADISWEAVTTQSWIQVTPADGVLSALASISVTVCVEAAATALPPGGYPDLLQFRNLANGVAAAIPVSLSIRTIATMPFFDDFESGGFQPYWEDTGTGDARAQVTSNEGPIDTYHALLDDAVSGNPFARNELTLTIDLAGWSNVILRCQAKEIGDEAHGPPPSPFIDGADFDGIAISEDGVTWYEVLGLRTLTSSFAEQVINLDAEAAGVGLSYNASFRIRFNQYDNFSVPDDGIAIDNVELTGEGPSPPALGVAGYVDSSGLPHSVWTTTSGTLYQFQCKTNLTDMLPWEDSGGVITSVSDTIDFIDTNAVDQTKFYRLLSD